MKELLHFNQVVGFYLKHKDDSHEYTHFKIFQRIDVKENSTLCIEVKNDGTFDF